MCTEYVPSLKNKWNVWSADCPVLRDFHEPIDPFPWDTVVNQNLGVFIAIFRISKWQKIEDLTESKNVENFF